MQITIITFFKMLKIVAYLHMSSPQLFVTLRGDFSFTHPSVCFNSIHSLSTLLVVTEIACYQPGNLSGSCKARDWSALGQNKSNQLLNFCSGLFSSESIRCIPASPSQCTFPVPVSCEYQSAIETHQEAPLMHKWSAFPRAAHGCN